MTGTMTREEESAETRSLPARVPAESRPINLPKDVYEPEAADATVVFPGCLRDERFWHVARSVIAFFLSSFMATFFADKKLSKEDRERAAGRLVKQLLIDLGPTYIKLGQFLSVRRDLLPVTIADELTSLQDRVPPFGLDLLRQTVTQELGAPPEELFAYFDPVPLASASIGQVHRVQLKDGKQAVLKVQRSGLAHDFYRDLGLMRLAAKAGLRYNEWKASFFKTLKIQGAKRPARFDFRNWLEMSDEFGKNLFAEVDYLLEGRNADRLRRLLRDRPEVRIPRVFWKYSARKVLTLEYIEGIKIDRVRELEDRGIDLQALGNLLITCYLEQFVIKGFFHADPHAGNLAVDRKGNLIIYDFGMMGEITESQRRSLLQCVLSTVNRDGDLLVKSLSELGVVRAGTNHEAISRAITPFMDYYAGTSLFDLDFRQLEHDIDTVVTERSLRLPANLAYILRAGSSLEGIARTLKSDFSFIQAVRPVVRRLVAIEGLESISTLQGLMQMAGLAVSGFKRVRDHSNQKDNHNRENSVDHAGVSGQSSKLLPATNKRALPCRKCVRQAVDLKRLKVMVFNTSFIGITYVTISTGTLISFNPGILTDYRMPGFYFVIGNIILGGIMIWKLIRLSKWNPKGNATDETQTNGDTKC